MADFPTLYSGNGVTTTFSVPWPYLNRSHVVVKLAGVTQTHGTHYTFPTAGQIQFVTPPPSGTNNVSVDRITPLAPISEFSSGPLQATDLNTVTKQAQYGIEETDYDVRTLRSDVDTLITDLDAEEAALIAHVAKAWTTPAGGGTVTKGSTGQIAKFDASGNLVPGALEASLAGENLVVFDTVAEIEAYSGPTDGQLVYLKDARRFGFFRFQSASLVDTLLPPSLQVTTTAVDQDLETFTKTAHKLTTGMAVTLTAAVNGLSVDRFYWVIGVDDDTFQLADTYADAMGSNSVNLTGTTNVTVKPHIDAEKGIYICPTANMWGAAGAWKRQTGGYLTPGMFGAPLAADGYADKALNALYAYVRASTIGQGDSFVEVTVDLLGEYKTEHSVNAGYIQAWNLTTRNGVIHGECQDYPVLDMSGSRGWSKKNLLIRGTAGVMPSCGILHARSTLRGACDNNSMEDVSCIGYFSVAAELMYGQETTHRRHCRAWNYNHEGYNGVYQGTNTVPVASKFYTLLTGAQSTLNNTWDNCDFRYLPITSNIAVITGLTRGATTSIVAAGHPYVNGDVVTFWTVGGTHLINGKSGTVSNATAGGFDVNIDTSAFGAYTSGGYAVRKATKPPIHWSGGSFNKFNNCYTAGYGDDSVEIDLSSAAKRHGCVFDFVHEGALSRSHYRFLVGTAIGIMTSSTFTVYNTFTAATVLSTDASGGGLVLMYGGAIEIGAHSNNVAKNLTDTPVRYAFYSGLNIMMPGRGSIQEDQFAAFRGSASAQDGDRALHEHNYGWADNGAYAVTVTSGTGTLGPGAVGTVTLRRFLGDLAMMHVDITIPDNGTGATHILFELPPHILIHADHPANLAGQETVTSGKSVRAFGAAGVDAMQIRNYDNSYPAANGSHFYLSGLVAVQDA